MAKKKQAKKSPKKKTSDRREAPDSKRADEFQAEASVQMSEAVGQDLLGLTSELAGIELRPVTMASVAMMMMSGSDLISGKALEDIPHLHLDVAKFVILHDKRRSLAQAGMLARGSASIVKLEKMFESGEITPEVVVLLEELFREKAYKTLDDEALEFMGTIPARDAALLNTQVILLTKEAMMTQVKPEPDKDADDSDDSGNV